MKTFARYALVQLPSWVIGFGIAWGLTKWFSVPGWIAWGLYALYVAKDFALFPFLRRAYEAHFDRGPLELIGAEGTAVEDIADSGYVRVRGELWKAEVARGAPSPLPKGARIRVQHVRGRTLIVMATDDQSGV